MSSNFTFKSLVSWWETARKYYLAIGSFFAFIAVITTGLFFVIKYFVDWSYGEEGADINDVIVLLIILLFVITLSLLPSLFIFLFKKPQKKYWEDGFNLIASGTAKYDMEVAELIDCLALTKTLSKSQIAKCELLLKNNEATARKLLDHTAVLYNTLLGVTCAVTLLRTRRASSASKVKIERWKRDTASDLKRRQVNESNVNDNEATQKLLESQKPYLPYNDISPDNFTYSRPDWHKDFNSLLVISIFETNKSMETNELRVIGFLCIDCMDGTFKEGSCVNWGLQVASRLAPIIKLNLLLKKKLDTI